MAVIEAHGIAKTYPPQRGKRALLGRGGLRQLFASPPTPRQALAPLSFTVNAGEALGIIGRNGSGKSTLLKLIAGVTAPTHGTLNVQGRVASLLELGAGFHPMLTGRENVYLNAGLLGMRHAQVDAAFEDIVAFAELEEFIDQTVDTYSSGMYVRLAFSVAIHTDPDIFLVDEVLAVGDESFQRKCRARILALKAAGKTILFVSHDLGIVQALCDRVLLLDQGTVIPRDGMQETIDYYLRQAGQSDAIHRLRHGETEVLFNHGRVSLYHRARELTAPLGLKVQLLSMGTYHESTDAEWKLIRCDEQKLEAVGTMPRLPVILFFMVELGPNGVSVTVRWENTRPLNLAYVAVQATIRTFYSHWYARVDSDAFPEIPPSQYGWSAVAMQQGTMRACELTGSTSTDTAPLLVAVEGTPDRCRFQIDNADYMHQARIVHLTDAIPSGDLPIALGRHTLGTMVLNPAMSPADVDRLQYKRRSSQQITAGLLTARLHRGTVALTYDGTPLTRFLHLHFQFRSGDLWTSSQAISWEETQGEGRERTATGKTPRLPASISWTLRADGNNTLLLEVAANVVEKMTLDECNISLFLDPAYTHWHTEHEDDDFGPLAESSLQWAHANRQFKEGTWISATAPYLPEIILTLNQSPGTVIPSALQADVDHPGHILQLISSPGTQPRFSLAPGRHTLFAATVVAKRGTEIV